MRQWPTEPLGRNRHCLSCLGRRLWALKLPTCCAVHSRSPDFFILWASLVMTKAMLCLRDVADFGPFRLSQVTYHIPESNPNESHWLIISCTLVVFLFCCQFLIWSEHTFVHVFLGIVSHSTTKGNHTPFYISNKFNKYHHNAPNSKSK